MKSKIIAIITTLFMVLTMVPMTTGISHAATVIDINDAEVTYEYEQEWTGSAIQMPSIRVMYGDDYLHNGVSYTVQWNGNIINPGIYENAIVLTGTDKDIAGKKVTGTRTLPIKVVKPETSSKPTTPSTPSETTVDISKAKINYTSSRTYTGKALNPITSVTYGGKTLTKGTDYTVSPSTVKYPGTYTITITGKGKYTGAVKKSVTVKVPTFATTISSVSTSKSAPYVKYSTNAPGASKVTYKVLYKTSSTGAWKTATSATTAKKLTIKGLAGKKTYAVIVTPTITLNGKKYTGSTAAKYKGITKPSGTAISTSSEFAKKINANPKGKYYLASNISLTAKSQIAETFKGTLDGNGFTIKGFTYSGSDLYKVAMFKAAKSATFKNLKITGVNLNIKKKTGATVATIATQADSCKFSNVKVYGKISVPNGACDIGSINYVIGGMIGYGSKCTFTSCVNNIDITAKCNNKYYGVSAGGIAATNSGGSMSKCTNTGNITLSGYTTGADSMSAAGLVAQGVDKVSSCKNSGKISVTMGSKSSGSGGGGAAGICGQAYKTIVSSKNTGVITLKHTGSAYNLSVAGITRDQHSVKGYMSKCSNKGAVTFSGKANKSDGVAVAGLAADCAYASQCFNKGTVKATITNSRGFGNVGGVCGIAYKIKNNYNVGKVYLKGYGHLGGLAGGVSLTSSASGCYNYNTGKVIPSGGVKKEKFYGAIFGTHDGNAYKHTANHNYYKKGTSSRSYGVSPITNKYKAKAKKVNSIKKITCPKLSNKYWKYSSKYKRMILKNNPE